HGIRCVFTGWGGVVPGDVTPLAVQENGHRVVDDLLPVGHVLFVEMQDAHPPTNPSWRRSSGGSTPATRHRPTARSTCSPPLWPRWMSCATWEGSGYRRP